MAGPGLEGMAHGHPWDGWAGHGLPVRVAVSSWLKPPDSSRRFTVEKPAWLRHGP